MRIFRIALLLVHAFVASRLTSGAAVDRHDSERHYTAVINLLDTRHHDRGVEEEEKDTGAGVARTTVQYGDGETAEDYYNYYYDDEEEDEELSGDIELPKVAMSTKPRDGATVLDVVQTETPQRRVNGRKRKGKGQGRKRNPCLKKYKGYCVHGSCLYLKELHKPSCVCNLSYSGHRCEFFILPSGKAQEGYSRTTALAVVAVVLSSLCLTIIGLLLALRFHKRGAYDIENEEKVKLGLAPHH